MKQIINGKRYDTETATEIASYDNGCYAGDFNSLSETLYRTKAGACFLKGSGGAMTGYATSLQGGKMLSEGSSIIPMSDVEAREWLELHDESDAIEALWPDLIVDA